jgi:hypothetical protein
VSVFLDEINDGHFFHFETSKIFPLY